MTIIPEPERLPQTELARLVRIAHETKDTDIRRHALQLLAMNLDPPPMVFKADIQFADEALK